MKLENKFEVFKLCSVYYLSFFFFYYNFSRYWVNVFQKKKTAVIVSIVVIVIWWAMVSILVDVSKYEIVRLGFLNIKVVNPLLVFSNPSFTYFLTIQEKYSDVLITSNLKYNTILMISLSYLLIGLVFYFLYKKVLRGKSKTIT